MPSSAGGVRIPQVVRAFLMPGRPRFPTATSILIGKSVKDLNREVWYFHSFPPPVAPPIEAIETFDWTKPAPDLYFEV
ncbi:MAG: hypothetical protein IANPNBLG_02762 [Bryobacteraceae bacterium]|nr:hypothetical protein [Bryobacteraceae bacterium]